MTHQITISQKLVDMTRELSRYHDGDLKDCDHSEWLENTNRLNFEIATLLSLEVRDQLPQERPHIVCNV